MDTHHRVLVLDDEDAIRELLAEHLEGKGCEVRCAASAEDAGRLVREWEPDAALVDMILPGRNGLQFIGELKRLHPDTAVLVMTTEASIHGALDAVRGGAGDYLEKPFGLDEMWAALQRALDTRRFEQRSRNLLCHEDDLHHQLTTSLPPDERTSGLAASAALGEVLEDFLRAITRELAVERASVMLFDERTRELEIVASHGIAEIEASGVRVPLGRSISGFVFETGEPFLVPDARNDDRLRGPNYPHLADSFLSAPIALAVPIRSRRQILGVVNVTNRTSGGALGPQDLAYLGALAGQLAGAIEGARRAEHLQRTYRTLTSTRDQLAFSERMRTVGQMATGMAHDFNDALSVILARAQFVAAHLDQPRPDLPRVRADLEAVIRAVMHAADTVKRLQDYTRIRKELAPTPIDLNAAIREACGEERRRLYGADETRSIDVVLDLAEIPFVCGNRFELIQVVHHLLSNAVDAMPGGGRLAIRTWQEQGAVLLEVRDSGSGMDEPTRERMFQPFFTTKPGRQGLGMSVVYGVVTRHGGRVDVRSAPGGGATFTLQFPLLDASERSSSGAFAAREVTSASRVLFVDDDEMVRETYEEALRMGGHEVVGTVSGARALELCRERDFDLVITDLSMGEMDGLELATRIKRDWPGLPIVLFSGFTFDEELRVREAGIDRVLVKPCLIEELLTVVRRTAREA